MSPENFFLDVKERSYIKLQSDRFHQYKAEKTVFYKKLLPNQEPVVLPCSKIMVSLVPLPLLNNRDFLFHPTTQTDLMLFIHIVNQQTSKVLIKNASNQMLCILYCHKFGYLINIIYDKSFLIDAHFAFDSLTSPLSSQQYLNLKIGLSFWPINSFIETILDNEVRVYGNAAAIRKIAELVAEYRTIWESQSFAVWKINDSTT